MSVSESVRIKVSGCPAGAAAAALAKLALVGARPDDAAQQPVAAAAQPRSTSSIAALPEPMVSEAKAGLMS